MGLGDTAPSTPGVGCSSILFWNSLGIIIPTLLMRKPSLRGDLSKESEGNRI